MRVERGRMNARPFEFQFLGTIIILYPQIRKRIPSSYMLRLKVTWYPPSKLTSRFSLPIHDPMQITRLKDCISRILIIGPHWSQREMRPQRINESNLVSWSSYRRSKLLSNRAQRGALERKTALYPSFSQH